ncbi:MAG: hypothetical protein K6G34_07890 [Lachnospiraceae bacterium]|nr:hypothetical protein [Lachnospiraceae bacterium]
MKKKNGLLTLLKVVLCLAGLAAIAYVIYQRFFAPDYLEDFEDDFDDEFDKFDEFFEPAPEEKPAEAE